MRNATVFLFAGAFGAGLLSACGPKAAQTDVSPLAAYVSDARSAGAAEKVPEGSLWTGHGRRSDLFRDAKASEVNDIVTIRVVESTSALVSADAKHSRNAETSTSIPNLFGLEKQIKELPNLVGGTSSSTYEGKGSTTRETTLQTTLSARVVEVLPNGYLVVEGAREVRVNNENQTVVLTGVVRPDDLSRGNVVLSSAVAQMSVRVQGRGIVSQPLKPGWLYRIMSGILPF
jgi:flagellar L-ring protein precursor FlgH